ncbi:hypothetical protein [Gemmatimonas aurantiaca]|nr:hypothetical protein [Gemmatimonas aurantiaca]
MSNPSTTPLSESEAPFPPRTAVPPYAAPALRGAGNNGSSVRLAAPYVPAAWRTHPLVASAVSVPPTLIMEGAFPTPAGVESLFGSEASATTIDSFARPEPLESLSPEQGTLDDSLPWIDAFLSTTPVVPMAAIAADENDAGDVDAVAPFYEETFATSAFEEAGDLDDGAVDGADVVADLAVPDLAVPDLAVEAPVVEVAEPETASSEVMTSEVMTSEVIASDEDVAAEVIARQAETQAEDWPLQQAASEFDALAEQLEALAPPVPTEPAALFAEPAQPEPLPAWSDDDMVDIMPVRQPLFTPRSLPAEPDHLIGAQAAHRDDNAEAAALALELLAGRVRAGDLPLAGYEPRMGDAAALVAALAALLGVKLR